MENNKISFSTDYADVLFEDGIIHADIHTGNASLEMVDNHVNTVGEQLKGHLPGLFVVYNIRTANEKSSKAVRDYFARNENFVSKVKALAVVMPMSGVAKIAANLFIKFSRPVYPMKIFNDKDQAVEWLKQFE